MTKIGRGLSTLIFSMVLGLSAGGARADDAACKTVLDAVIKQAGMPVRQIITIETAASPGKPLKSEIIRLSDTLYMQVGNQWVARPYDSQKAVSDSRQSMQKAAHTCARLRNDAVDGKQATVYSVQTKGEQGTTESEIWIGADGLPVRQHTDMQGPSKSRHEVRFDYTNVTAPTNIRR
ncbi:MAG: hypothetical protein JWQ58_1204 [Reyranella sp.]|nr:hypothetical protein [Reyranella sp.]